MEVFRSGNSNRLNAWVTAARLTPSYRANAASVG